jgi:3',5'-cyclic AMP phosphodiesterase CpdA
MGFNLKIGRFIVGVLLTAAMLGFSGCASSTTVRATTNATAVNSGYFTIAVLPDTQYYSQKYPEIFTQQTQWIVDNAKTQNIVFVSQEGDLVDNYSSDQDYEWKNAQKAMGIIRNAGIPYSVVPGNHDVNFEAGDTTYFDKYFPFTDFARYPWYGSGKYPPPSGVPQPNYPANSNASNYETFSALGQNFVVLNLACTPKVLVNAELYTWADSVLQYYSNDKAIVVTHGYIDTKGNYTDSSNVSGIEIWQNVVKPNSNVVAVFCGHIHGEYNATATAAHGNTVENLLFDTQDDPHGGDGWLRLYKFYPQQNKVSAVTYSPYLNEYDSSATGAFDFKLTMTK